MGEQFQFIFPEDKQIRSINQILEGISHITGDLELAKYIIEFGFPDEFNEENNAKSNPKPDHIFNHLNIGHNYLKFYKS